MRYAVFRFAQNDVAPCGRIDAMFSIKCGEDTHHQAQPIINAKHLITHNLPKAIITEKTSPYSDEVFSVSNIKF